MKHVIKIILWVGLILVRIIQADSCDVTVRAAVDDDAAVIQEVIQENNELDAAAVRGGACCSLAPIDARVKEISNTVNTIKSKIINVQNVTNNTFNELGSCCALLNSRLSQPNTCIDISFSAICDLSPVLTRLNEIDADILTCCALLNSKLDNITVTIPPVSGLDRIDTCCALLNSKLDIISNQVSKTDADILTCCAMLNSKIDNITVIIPPVTVSGLDRIDTCCALLNSRLDTVTNLISKVDADILTCCATLNSKIDNITVIIPPVTVSGLDRIDTCCALLNSRLDIITNQISKVDADVLTCCATLDLAPILTRINQVDADILTCCSNLTNQISKVDADVLTCCASLDLAPILTRINQVDADILTCCSNLTNQISKVDADVLTCCASLDLAPILTRINQVDADILTCCASLSNQISKVDADVLTCCATLDLAPILTRINQVDADILTCCASLSNQISKVDADVLTCCATLDLAPILTRINQVDADILTCCASLSNQISKVDADVLTCCASLDLAPILTRINQVDADILTCCASLSNQISKVDADVLTCCATLDLAPILTRINQVDADILTCCASLSNQISKVDADVLTCCATLDLAPILTRINQVDADILTCCASLSNQISKVDADVLTCCASLDLAPILTRINQVDADILTCCASLSNQISKVDADVLTCCASLDLAPILTRINQVDADILTCCASLSNQISKVDADVLTCCATLDLAPILTRINQVDADILTCCASLSNQISKVDADVLTCCATLDLAPILTRINQVDADILTCCASLTNLISFNDALIETKIDTVRVDIDTCCALLNSKLDVITNQISKVDADVLTCCATLDLAPILTLINQVDADILTCCASLSNQISKVDADVLTCCATLDLAPILTLINQVDADILTCCASLSNQISKVDADVLTCCTELNSRLDLLGACGAIPITGPTTITSAGYYCLANDFTTANAEGIFVNSNDVVIDLNNNKITMTSPGAAGIINNGYYGIGSNLTIKNGTIETDGSSITSIGLDFESINNVTVSNVTTLNTLGTDRGDVGIRLLHVSQALIQNCKFYGGSLGIFITSSDGIVVENCIAEKAAETAFDLSSSFTCIIKDCQAFNTGYNNGRVIGTQVIGFASLDGSANIFERCIANSTQAPTTTDSNSVVAGFALSGSENCSKIIDCEASNASTSPSGVTVPYGILLQKDSRNTLVRIVNNSSPVPGGVPNSVKWSPDVKFVAAGMDTSDTLRVHVYAFDNINNKLIQIATPVGSSVPTDSVASVDWSPDEMYIAAGMASGDNAHVRVYAFDQDTNILVQVATLASDSTISGNVTEVKWSPDAKYLAVTTDQSSGPIVYVYFFDRINNVLSLASSGSVPAFSALCVAWSPDGRFLAVGLDQVGYIIRIYSFDPNVATLTVVAGGPSQLAIVSSIDWTTDGKYIANGDNSGAIYVYSFNQHTSAFNLVAFNKNFSDPVTGVNWSDDGTFLAAGRSTTVGGSNGLETYQFDAGGFPITLTQVGSTAAAQPNNSISWSKDGHYIVTANNSGSAIKVFVPFDFPSDNMIVNNKVYCNSSSQTLGTSGVGISGSSICNYIVGNTAYSNPTNPTMISTNYQFVCNVFNQLFGEGPTLLQNISLGTCQPIGQPDDLGLLVKQAKAQISNVQTSINQVSVQISKVDADVLTCCATISLTPVLTRLNQIDADILTCCSTINSKLDLINADAETCCALLSSKLDDLKNFDSVNDALIETMLNGIKADIDTCCATLNSKLDVITNQVSKVDADVLTCCATISLGPVLTKLNQIDADILTCCASLSNQISFNDALIETKIDALSLCGPTPITGPTTITSQGVFCIANPIGGSIVVSSSNVALLNSGFRTSNIVVNPGLDQVTINGGTIVGASPAIDVLAGCTNITIKNVVVKNGSVGIHMTSVARAIVDSCQMTSNVTGLQLEFCHDVAVSNCIASANTHAGYSLISSTTNTLSDCKALGTGEGNTTVLNNNVFGFVSQNGTTNVFERCIASATQALSTTDFNSIVAGFALVGTENCSKIINSEAANSTTSISGVTIPYGILLEGTLGSRITLTGVPSIPMLSNPVTTIDWSSDAKYVVIGLGGTDQYFLRVFQFYRATNILSQVAVPDMSPASGVLSVEWSPDSKYIAVGVTATDVASLRVYSFDSINNALDLVTSLTSVSVAVDAVAWSPDGNYLGVGYGDNSVRVINFDRVTNELTPIVTANVLPTTPVAAVDWSSDGRYLAVGAGAGDPTPLKIYFFDQGSSSLQLVASSSAISSVSSVEWSPNGQFVAVASSQVNIFNFIRATNSLIPVAVPTSAPVGTSNTVSWSSDGKYVVAGTTAFLEPNKIYVYSFDPSTHLLIPVAIPDIPPAAIVNSVAWSPDGRFIAAGLSADTFVTVYGAISFPSDNIITGDTVYCNSSMQSPYPVGVGISGSSVCNYIVGNTAYSNPVNPVIASSNYYFVCNAFSQFFGNAPTGLQNIALGTCEPISQPDNEALLIRQVLARLSILESKIDQIISCVCPGNCPI